MRRRVREALRVLAFLAPLVVVTIATLLYQVDSATTVGTVTEVRPALMTYRADIRFTTAAGDEVWTTESVDQRAIGAVRIRYLPLSPWLFNTLDGRYDTGILALALVIGATLGLVWLVLGAGLQSSINALLQLVVGVGLCALAAVCLLYLTGSPTVSAMGVVIGLLLVFQSRPAVAGR
jgi:hypothetical protein